MTRRLAVPLTALALALALVAGPAQAGSATSTLTVSADVIGTCTIAPQTLSFGTNDPQATLDASGSITVNCTQGTVYSIVLGGTNADRSMSGPNGDILEYDLYTDAARSTAWENATAVAGTATTTGAGLAAYSHPVYGRIPSGQQVSTGAYTGTIAMTVNF